MLRLFFWKSPRMFGKLFNSYLFIRGGKNVKFYLYQILFVGVIWIGMFFFRDELYDSGRIIFYLVTSWLLFLIVLAVKQYLNDRSEEKQHNDQQKKV